MNFKVVNIGLGFFVKSTFDQINICYLIFIPTSRFSICPFPSLIYIFSGADTPKIVNPFLITARVATAKANLASANFF